jgi:hypothetical protein
LEQPLIPEIIKRTRAKGALSSNDVDLASPWSILSPRWRDFFNVSEYAPVLLAADKAPSGSDYGRCCEARGD